MKRLLLIASMLIACVMVKCLILPSKVNQGSAMVDMDQVKHWATKRWSNW